MLIWIAFLLLIFTFLALDLGVFNKNPHHISTKEALTWTTIWVSISLSFSGVIYLLYSNDMIANTTQLTPIQAVIKYLTGYLIELSLSLDNIFVIAVVFGYFKVPRIYQHRVLFWGILGAVVFRAIFIFVGVILIESISWMTYVFGALLLYSAYKMFKDEGEEIDPRNNPIVKMVKRFYPVTRDFESDKFWVKRRKITAVTPLFIALVVVETTDILFAIDSIPAILAITTDPFLVFTSNIFAILGLRSLYFVLAAMLDRFKLLKYSLVLILAFVGVKLILAHHVHFPEWLSLAVIVLSLAGGIVASLFFYKKTEEEVKEGSL